ncbi:BatA domain-containing protein [Stieleria sp. JC731]|uniref:BatA domain-containing protein n=1 Tax=Pirellulaceae TaxID=2691357 RepID=UPI001E58C1E0|nr:BatA domain-containing protein [Stieleria sp. JC731]MCC9604182.1 BatA domain-containing protein [Stieleria sp. JC731]
MNFLNGTLLIAIAAVGIPIALHLIARKEPRKVLFPSVRLLSQRFESNRSKMRVRRLWLLALRIAAIAAVALALARPVSSVGLSSTWLTIGILGFVGIVLLLMASVAATKSDRKPLIWSLAAAGALAILAAVGWAGGTVAGNDSPSIDRTQPIALAIVVDNAIDTSWSTNDDDRMKRIREAAKSVAVAAGQNSRLVAIDRSATPATFSADTAGAIAKIDGFRPSEVTQALASRIEAAARVLATSEIKTRRIVVFSALTQSSFPEDDSTRSIRSLLEDESIRLTVWDMGPYQGLNRQLSLATFSNASPAPDSPVSVTAQLSIGEPNERRMDTQPDEQTMIAETLDVTAECVLFPSQAGLPVIRDGKVIRPTAKPVDRISVAMAPNRNVEIQLTIPPLEAGLHHGAIRLIGDDALAIDDQCFFSVEILPPSRMLVASDELAEANEFADLISVEANGAPSQYTIEFSTHNDLPNVQLDDFDAIALLDPPEVVLRDQEIERYQRSGKRTLIALGPHFGTSPGPVAGLVFQRRWRVQEPGTYLQISSDSHPALKPLVDLPGEIPFHDSRVWQYWQTKANKDWSTLMRYAGTEHAALLEHSNLGILLLTTPIPDLVSRKPWNDLFRTDNVWPAFALTRELARYAAGRQSGHWSTSVGNPVALPARYFPIDRDEDSPKRVQWFAAQSNAPIPIELPSAQETDDQALNSNEKLLAVGTPLHSGIHWIRGATPGLGFTVNFPRDKVLLSRIADGQLEQQFGDSVNTIEGLDEMDWTNGGAEDRLPLWSPIMLIALAAFLLEQILANRFYAQRRSQQSPKSKSKAVA